MTRKTGNFKSFPVFVRMLSTGLSGASDAVLVDVLTSADLELLKAKKAGHRPPPAAAAAPLAKDKRYIILTYAVEFDRCVRRAAGAVPTRAHVRARSGTRTARRVHYPLPLKFDSSPDPADLQRTIQRLRHELEQVSR